MGEALLIVIGAFYVFAGYVATRAQLMSSFLDRAITEIDGKALPMAERVQSIWLLLASLLVLAGGAALMLRLEAALWFFLVSCFGQALYIGLIAPRFFDPGNPPDLAGRRQTTNAFLIYVAATVVVVWAFSAGLLVSWRAVPWFVLAAACLATAAYSAYAIWQLIQSLRGTARGDDA